MKIMLIALICCIIFTGIVAMAQDTINILDYFKSKTVGDEKDIAVKIDNVENSATITYTSTDAGKGWAAIYWLYPENNLGSSPGLNLVAYKFKKLSFDAKGKERGEKAEFLVGGIKGAYSDSLDKSIGTKNLTNDWVSYEITLNDADWSNVVDGFCCVIRKGDNVGMSPVNIQLRNIKYAQ